MRRLLGLFQKLLTGKDIRDKLPKYLRNFDKLLRKVNTGYFVGEQVSSFNI